MEQRTSRPSRGTVGALPAVIGPFNLTFRGQTTYCPPAYVLGAELSHGKKDHDDETGRGTGGLHDPVAVVFNGAESTLEMNAFSSLSSTAAGGVQHDYAPIGKKRSRSQVHALALQGDLPFLALGVPGGEGSAFDVSPQQMEEGLRDFATAVLQSKRQVGGNMKIANPDGVKQEVAVEEEDAPTPEELHIRSAMTSQYFRDVLMWQRLGQLRETLGVSPMGKSSNNPITPNNGALLDMLYSEKLLTTEEDGTTAPNSKRRRIEGTPLDAANAQQKSKIFSTLGRVLGPKHWCLQQSVEAMETPTARRSKVDTSDAGCGTDPSLVRAAARQGMNPLLSVVKPTKEVVGSSFLPRDDVAAAAAAASSGLDSNDSKGQPLYWVDILQPVEALETYQERSSKPLQGGELGTAVESPSSLFAEVATVLTFPVFHGIAHFGREKKAPSTDVGYSAEEELFTTCGADYHFYKIAGAAASTVTAGRHFTLQCFSEEESEGNQDKKGSIRNLKLTLKNSSENGITVVSQRKWVLGDIVALQNEEEVLMVGGAVFIRVRKV